MTRCGASSKRCHIKLSDRETTTIAAAFHPHDAVEWRDIVSTTVTTTRSLCINRWMSLTVTGTNGNNDVGSDERELSVHQQQLSGDQAV